MQKEWTECHPDSWYANHEESSRPAYSEVARMITILMGAFPTAKIPEPEIFVRLLIDDVMALEPSFVELESTCRALRTKKNKFMPSISEVIEELEKQQELWSHRWGVAWYLEELHEELPSQIASAKVAEEALLARKKVAQEAAKAAEEAKAKALADRKAAKSQPIVVGDRVRNCNAGAGTVTAIEQYTPEIVKYRVRFDVIFKGKNEDEVGAQYLERLIPGDEGYEPPALPMIEQRKQLPTSPWDEGVRASDVPIAPRTVKVEDEF